MPSIDKKQPYKQPFKYHGLRAWYWCFVAYWRLLIVSIQLRLNSFDWLKNQVSINQRGADLNNFESVVLVNDSRLLALHEAIRLAARLHFFAVDCLPKSLVLRLMLTKQAYNSRVVIGVAKSNNGIASHAWVEVQVDGQYAMLGEPEQVNREFSRL